MNKEVVAALEALGDWHKSVATRSIKLAEAEHAAHVATEALRIDEDEAILNHQVEGPNERARTASLRALTAAARAERDSAEREVIKCRGELEFAKAARDHARVEVAIAELRHPATPGAHDGPGPREAIREWLAAGNF